MSSRRVLIALAALAVAAGCNKDKTVEPPAELVDLQPTLAVRELWSEGVGGGGEELRLTLGLAGDDDVLFAAARDGEVRALDAANGRERWRTDTKLELTAGPGVGSGLVVVGTPDGDIVVLEAASGERKWKVRIHAEVLAPPLVTGDRVVVRSVDGRLRALDAADGKELWMVEEPVPRLSLRGTAAPVAAGDTVICGFDTGKVMAVSLASGEIVWQVQISTARGRTELERLADVDSAVRVAGTDVYAVGYHGRVAMLALDSGQVWWSRDVSSYRGLALDEDQVYVASSEGTVIALRRRDGSIVWQQEGLARRDLSTPAVDGEAVVVGDYDGYLHWLDRATGKFVARVHAGGERIAAPPLVLGGRVFTIDEGGHVAAYQSGGSTGG
jgi:outer membrane protein assembly factor BamB